MIIGELAERTGVNTWTLRHYEKAGLIPSTRGSNRYREFDETAIRQVVRIRCLIAAGLSVADIRQVLPCIDDSGQLLSCPAVQRVVDQRLLDIEDKLVALNKAHEILRTARESLQPLPAQG